ncbi:MAG: hypothetical protein JWM33_3993 [Caulobacteraceae bacterium]|nr:hypothetical protein [Caulobacteraceae bacterium]
MTPADRKAAIAAYKERKTACGVFAVRCAPSGQVWIGDSRHLDTQQNGIWFSLRQGSGRNPALQAAWTEHGEAAFSFEALERLADDTSAYLLRSALKARAAFWRAELDGLAV